MTTLWLRLLLKALTARGGVEQQIREELQQINRHLHDLTLIQAALARYHPEAAGVRHALTQTTPIPLPRDPTLNPDFYAQVEQVRQALADRLGREPTDDELGQQLGIEGVL